MEYLIQLYEKRKIIMRESKIQLFFLFLIIFGQNVFSQTFVNGYYRLTTQWQGEGKSLDIINDGANNKLQLASTANVSGQLWKFIPLGNNYYRLTTQWLGETKSLDVITDGINYKLQLEASDDVSGQYWKITPLGNGFYRITTKLLGMVKSLDVVADGSNNKLQLANTGNFSGQFWKITEVSGNPAIVPESPPINEFKQQFISGFKIMINPNIADKPETKEALEILAQKLEEITKIVKPNQLNQLRKVPFWIQFKLKPDGAMWYHTSKEWLVSNGYPAELENSVEIKNIRNFIDWQGDQPYMVLHELAHAAHDLFLPELKTKIETAYQKALSGGKYNSVLYIRGGQQKAYAMNNSTEYFAELTEAYFGKNDYYPFNREDLKSFDPLGFQIMQEAWN